MAELVSIKRNVDVSPGQAAPAVFHCSQGDVGSKIILGLLNNGTAYSIPSGVTVTIEGSESNGSIFTPISATVSGSDITFYLTGEMTAVAGPAICQAVLKSGSNILGTANFTLEVESSPMGADAPPVFTDAGWTWMLNKLNTEFVPALGNETIIDAIDSKADQSDLTALSNTVAGHTGSITVLNNTVNTLNQGVTENRQNIALKLDKNQGTANAGKYLKVQPSGQVVPVDLIDNSLLVETMAADAKATGVAISKKLNKYFGQAEAGKYLKVGTSGYVDSADLDVTTDKTLSITDKAADAKAVGDELDDLKADLTDTDNKVNGVISESYDWEQLTRNTEGVSILSGYIDKTGDIKTGSGYETLIFPIQEDCTVYPVIRTSFKRFAIYNSSEPSTASLIAYIATADIPTQNNPYSVKAGQYVGLSHRPNGDTKQCDLFAGTVSSYSLDPSVELSQTMITQIDNKIGQIAPVYDFDSIGTIIGVSHMGYHATAPENTLPAFRCSKSKGFNMVECDIQFTSDLIPVLSHDSTINRACCNAADGSTISETVTISDKTYSELQAYDACIPSKWATYKGTKIPRFSDLLALCKCLGLYIVIDCKGLNDAEKVGILVDLLEEYQMKKSVIFTFNAIECVITASSADEEIYLADYETDITTSYVNQLKALLNGYRRVGYMAYNITSEKVDLCKTNGVDVGLLTTSGDATTEQNLISGMDKRISFVTANLTDATQFLYNQNIGDANTGLLT